MLVKFVTVGPYEGAYRDIARGVKVKDEHSLFIGASALRNIIPDDAVLIPVPSHDGKADSNLILCALIAHGTHIPVCDCIKGTGHKSLCELKHEETNRNLRKGSLMPKPEQLGFSLTKKIPEGKTPVIIDNVVASGTTAIAAASLFSDPLVFCIACDYDYPKYKGLIDYTESWKNIVKVNRIY